MSITYQPRKKSPRAPSMPLNEALDRALKLYELERLHSSPVDVVATGIGYKSANSGSALAALASLRYFGLLERPKDGFLAIAKAVESYKFSPSDAQRREILLQFLKTPPLYAELLEKYASGLPSDASLKYELIQRGFIPAGAETAMASFKESVIFSMYFESRANQISIEDDIANENENDWNANDEELSIAKPARKNGNMASAISMADDDEELDRFPVRLPGGRKAWIIIPSLFYEADKNRLKAQIDLLLTEEDEL